MKFVFSLSLSLLFCCHVAADTIPTYTLFGVDIQLAQMRKDTAISVVTSDQVSDGCWTSGQASEFALQRELIDAGYTNITEASPFGASVFITAIGYSSNEYSCAVSVTLSLWLANIERREFGNALFFSFGRKNALEYTSILTGPKTDMSDRIKETVRDYADQLIVDIQKHKNFAQEQIGTLDATQAEKHSLLDTIVD
ncbi:hypothetical protein [Sulfitobacter sp. CW3]|uniref:hypothetical protein n=1 Tax=Sulfitobacter sp. CW3 TaxID=2861965 RepID=UPI001C5F900F|nr:hypothetical protein [Sulfitobacter sp. CW3]MBW4963645.1 hypothetical protein [Sulfitobacter sp. CW3]